MPFISEDELLDRTPGTKVSHEIGVLPEESPQQVLEGQPTFGETVGAWFKQENTVFNATQMAIEPELSGQLLDKNFNPIDHIEGYEEFAEEFVGLNNRQDVAKVKNKLDFEREQKDIIARSGTMANIVGALSAGILDPINLIPAFSTFKIASRGKRLAQGLASGTAFGAAAGVGREAVFQSNQLTRTAEETLTNIFAEAALGGIIGGAVGAISAPTRAASKAMLAKAMKGEDYQIELKANETAEVKRSASAAETTGLIEDEGFVHLNETLAKTLSGPKFLQSPTLRGLTSKSGLVRQLTNKMFLHNFIVGKNTKGVATENVAEKLMDQDIAEYNKVRGIARQKYLKYAGVGKIKGALGITPKDKVSYKEFNEKVSRALRDVNYVDEISEVREVADLYRAQMTKYTKLLQEVGVLSKELDETQMMNYLNRVYDLKKLNDVDTRSLFIQRISKYIAKHNKDGTLRATPITESKRVTRSAAKFTTKDGKEVVIPEEFVMVSVEDLAEESLLKILKESDEQNSLASLGINLSKGTGASKFQKPRLFQIADSELEPFLVNDAENLVANYVHRASSLARTQKAIQDLGYEDLGKLIGDIREERNRKLAGITDKKARQRVEEEFEEAANVAQMIYKSMNNTLRTPGKLDKWFETLRSYQFVRLLGGVTISSLPEMFMPAFRLGLTTALRDAYLPMIRDFKTAKLTKDQLSDFVVGLEAENNQILRQMADNELQLGTGNTSWDRHMGALSNIYGKATGISYFTAMGRRLAGQGASAQMVRILKRGANQKEIEQLASIGLSKDLHSKALKQIEKYTEETRGSFVMNLHMWDDVPVRNAVKAAIQNQVEATILKPGKGDIPFLIQSSQMARTYFQFKSFMSAATGRISLSAIQRKDMTTAIGLLGVVAMGSLTEIVKDLQAGRDLETDIDQLISSGLSRSGVLGLLGTTLLDIGLNLHNPKTRRFGGNISGVVTGPTISMLEDAENLLSKSTDGKFNRKDAEAVKRLLPFQNHFLIQELFKRIFPPKEKR
jgi:hypothetical protein